MIFKKNNKKNNMDSNNNIKEVLGQKVKIENKLKQRQDKLTKKLKDAWVSVGNDDRADLIKMRLDIKFLHKTDYYRKELSKHDIAKLSALLEENSLFLLMVRDFYSENPIFEKKFPSLKEDSFTISSSKQLYASGTGTTFTNGLKSIGDPSHAINDRSGRIPAVYTKTDFNSNKAVDEWSQKDKVHAVIDKLEKAGFDVFLRIKSVKDLKEVIKENTEAGLYQKFKDKLKFNNSDLEFDVSLYNIFEGEASYKVEYKMFKSPSDSVRPKNISHMFNKQDHDYSQLYYSQHNKFGIYDEIGYPYKTYNHIDNNSSIKKSSCFKDLSFLLYDKDYNKMFKDILASIIDIDADEMTYPMNEKGIEYTLKMINDISSKVYEKNSKIDLLFITAVVRAIYLHRYFSLCSIIEYRPYDSSNTSRVFSVANTLYIEEDVKEDVSNFDKEKAYSFKNINKEYYIDDSGNYYYSPEHYIRELIDANEWSYPNEFSRHVFESNSSFTPNVYKNTFQFEVIVDSSPSNYSIEQIPYYAAEALSEINTVFSMDPKEASDLITVMLNKKLTEKTNVKFESITEDEEYWEEEGECKSSL